MRTLVRQAAPGDLFAVVRDIADRLGLTDLAARARESADLVAGAPLGVAVVGQFKAGKSSLINSLLGSDLLPVRAIPATSVVTTVRHGDGERAVVRFAAGGSASIESDELADFVTEQRNPDNVKGARLVEVTTCALAGYPGLVFVDTPGQGSVHELSTAASTDWLPHVGVAVLAVPATQPLGAADVDLLDHVATHTPHLLVVVTKADLVAPDDLADVLVFIAGWLSERVGRDLVVLPYSTASGYDEMRAAVDAYLRGLQERHTEASSQLIAHRAAQLAEECRRYLLLATASAEADGAARERLRQALEDERRRARRVLAEALALIHPYDERIESTLIRHAERRARVVADRLQAQLAAQLPRVRGSLAAETSWISAWLRQTVSSELEPEARVAADLAGPILQDARGPLDGLGQAFSQRLGQHVRGALGLDFDPPVVAPPTREPEHVDVTVDAVFDSHLELLSWAVPMVLVRPLVHRHFLRMVRWQVEKNALRVGYATSAATTRALDQLAADYAAALDAQVTACERLVGTLNNATPDLRDALAELDAAVSA